MTAYEALRETAEAAWAPFKRPTKTLIRVNLGTCSLVVGAQETLEAIRASVRAAELDADVMATGCTGFCFAEPLVEVTQPDGPAVL